MPSLNALIDLKRFDAELQTGTDAIPLFRVALKCATESLRSRFESGETAATLVAARAAMVDAILQRAWQSHIDSSNDDIALIAVGGYGRGELHPGSDIDIMILLDSEQHQHHAQSLEKLITFLWDIGLEIGHSVRTLADCLREARQDITVATNLMEARLLAGPPSLFEAMRNATAADRIWPGREFFEAKWQEQIARHHKYNDSAYNLEPNIKEGPGGLRDIQMIGWVAKRHFNADTLHDLVSHKFLTEEEHHDLIEGQNFLWKIRFALHILTKRREDRLLFDYQRTLAKQFGYHDSDTALGVEQFMREYYRTIMDLSRLNEMLLQLFQEAILYADDSGAPTPLNKRFQLRKGFIEVTHKKIFEHYPFALLEIFLLNQQHPEIKGVRAATIRLIRNHRHLIDQTFRDDLRNRSLFMEIFRQPVGLTHELRRMNRYGILANYLPIFGKIVGLMQYDLFHIYTVDEHTLMVIRNLRRMTVSEHDQELPFCSRLIKQIPKLELLYLGGLFHDIAKGRGGNHSELGETDAIAFCNQHGLSNHDASLVGWLVRNHLLMSSTAQRKDISDPAVITEFAARVGHQTRLDYLYLLTVADIRGTNHTLWNAWRNALLQELYRATKRALRRGIENPIDQSTLINETQSAALALLSTKSINKDDATHLWQHLSEDYFLRHTAEEVAWQTGAVIHNKGKAFPLILAQQDILRGGTEIFIHMPDAAHLFATTTRNLDQLGLTVVDARIMTSDRGYTFDTYIVLEQSGEPITGQQRIDEILSQLKQALSQNKFDNQQVRRRTARQLKHFNTPTEISFSQDIRNHRTAMELITGDRPGLLSMIGQALMDCNINLQTAKIATIGERAEDVFFISDEHNQPIDDEQRLNQLRQRITDYLDQAMQAGK